MEVSDTDQTDMMSDPSVQAGTETISQRCRTAERIGVPAVIFWCWLSEERIEAIRNALSETLKAILP